MIDFSKYAGRGLENLRITDQNFWDDDESFDLGCWLRAFEDFDRKGDCTALNTLIRSSAAMPPKAQNYLTDLLYRHRPYRKGRPPTPAYDRSHRHLVRYLAMQMMAQLVRSGMNEQDAVTRIKSMYNIRFDIVDEWRRARSYPENRPGNIFGKHLSTFQT